MATVSISDRPTYVFDSSPAVTSRWVCAWNPVVYEFEFLDIIDPTTYLVVYVYEVGTNTLLGKSNYSPRNGTVKVDIAHFVRSYIYNEYEPDFSEGINCRDAGSTINVYIKYQLNTASTTGTITSDQSNNLYITESAKQIGQEYGANMAEFVPQGLNLLDAQFLTKFEQPVYFVDYPFTISFIYSEMVIGHELFLEEERLDINEQSINDLETELDITQGHSINLLKLQDSYNASVNYVDIALVTGDAVEELYVSEGYVQSGYTEAR
jgi:hypothetical protein